MKRQIFWIASLALGMAACTDTDINNDEPQQDVTTPTEEVTSNLTTVHLATFSGDQSRVTYETGTRADGDEDVTEPKTLELLVSIENPHPKTVFDYVNPEDGTRLMSATSIYHNESDDKYYITYHVQGNNYNTELKNSIGGAIQAFHIDNNGDIVFDDGFRAANPDQEDFDFNHIYFDNTDSRIIAVGHNVKNGNQKNTNAIVGVFDPNAGTYTYSTVKTSEKEYDTDGKSLGYKDAGDVNCIVRTNDVPSTMNGVAYGWDIYLVATRKGMAVLHADAQNLFKPYQFESEDGTSINYFINTPGSAKYVAATGTSSDYGLLYLAESHEGNVTADMESKANILRFKVNTYPKVDLLTGWLNDEESILIKPIEDILNYQYQVNLPKEITPIDGKNTLSILGTAEYYVALGTGGMYCNNGTDGYNGVKTFGNRPVNCVAVDNNLNESGYSNKGYLYVANGSKLSILERKNMTEVVSYNMPSTDDNGDPIESSANFIHVDKKDNGDRIVTVAFGQAGVRIFKFVPPTK